MSGKDQTEEKKVPTYNHVCSEDCFRKGVRYSAGDIMEGSTEKRAPKHFQGFDPLDDPDKSDEENKAARDAVKEVAAAKRAGAKARAQKGASEAATKAATEANEAAEKDAAAKAAGTSE